MKKILQIVGGVVLGILAAFTFLHIEEIRRMGPSAPRGTILSETSGAMTRIVIQFSSMAPEELLSPFHDFLTQIAEDVSVDVACRDQAEFLQFNARLSQWGVPHPERFRCVEVGLPITIWSKDRFVVVDGADGKTLLIPESPHEGDMLRQNDYQVASKLAAAAGWKVRRLPLMFDGGDVYATAGILFANHAMVEKNVPARFGTQEELKKFLEREMGKKVVIFREGTPTHHIGMFITPLSDTTIVAGDPALATGLIDFPDADFSEGTVKKFHEAIAQLEELGFTVIRTPLIPTKKEKVYVTYNNSIIEERGSKKIVYLPAYGIGTLDSLAAGVWKQAGFEVRPIRVKSVHHLGGTIHCMVNVLDRK